MKFTLSTEVSLNSNKSCYLTAHSVLLGSIYKLRSGNYDVRCGQVTEQEGRVPSLN